MEISNEVVTNVVAIGAIIISIFTWAKTDRTTKKISEKEFNQRFFEEIFFKYIIDKFPRAVINLDEGNYNNKSGCTEIETIVLELLEKASFYKFYDIGFYNRLSQILIEIDDNIVEMKDMKISEELYLRKKNLVSTLAFKLYDLLRQYYSNIDFQRTMQI